MIDKMYADWIAYKAKYPMYSTQYLWERWIRTI